MDKLKIIFRNFIFLKIKIFLVFIKNFNHNQYSLWAMLFPPNNLSDFFIMDTDCEKVVFIAENIRSLILGREVNVTHNFKFFSQDGIFLGKQTFKGKEFFNKIKLKTFKTNEKYISFIHYVESDLSFKEIFFEKGINFNFKINEQNRGYSVFYPLKSNTGSVVHGNFGGITKDLKKTAKKTFLSHIYTPIYKFEKHLQYDIVFNNPTKKNLNVEIIFNNSLKKIKLKISPLGTQFLRINNYDGSLSFKSKLPICRALIFKNPTPNSLGNFDVFHS
tara:strand:- start:267 stop:1091 length:825 start_codon:yes stop_codon:yes gene_type:complete